MYLLNPKSGTLHRKDMAMPRQYALCGKYPLLRGAWQESKEPPRQGVKHICRDCPRIAKRLAAMP